MKWYTERAVYPVSKKEYNEHISTTKRYSSHFKQEALVLSDEIGLKKVARKQGLLDSTLLGWRKTINHYGLHKELTKTVT